MKGKIDPPKQPNVTPLKLPDQYNLGALAKRVNRIGLYAVLVGGEEVLADPERPSSGFLWRLHPSMQMIGEKEPLLGSQMETGNSSAIIKMLLSFLSRGLQTV